jgi:hypothetical protein
MVRAFKTATALCLIVVLIVEISVAAQSHPNLSGVWRLDPSESRMIGGPLGEITWKINHHESNIAVTINVNSPQGSHEFAFTCTMDGKECVNKLLNEVRRSTATWEDNVLVMNTKAETPDGGFEAMDRIRVSDNGQTLVFERTVKDTRGERVVKQVFRKVQEKR